MAEPIGNNNNSFSNETTKSTSSNTTFSTILPNISLQVGNNNANLHHQQFPNTGFPMGNFNQSIPMVQPIQYQFLTQNQFGPGRGMTPGFVMNKISGDPSHPLSSSSLPAQTQVGSIVGSTVGGISTTMKLESMPSVAKSQVGKSGSTTGNVSTTSSNVPMILSFKSIHNRLSGVSENGNKSDIGDGVDMDLKLNSMVKIIAFQASKIRRLEERLKKIEALLPQSGRFEEDDDNTDPSMNTISQHQQHQAQQQQQTTTNSRSSSRKRKPTAIAINSSEQSAKQDDDFEFTSPPEKKEKNK